MDKETLEALNASGRLPYGVKIHKALYGATTLNEMVVWLKENGKI